MIPDGSYTLFLMQRVDRILPAEALKNRGEQIVSKKPA